MFLDSNFVFLCVSCMVFLRHWHVGFCNFQVDGRVSRCIAISVAAQKTSCSGNRTGKSSPRLGPPAIERRSSRPEQSFTAREQQSAQHQELCSSAATRTLFDGTTSQFPS
ncbi:hypothetical protein E4U32_008063 [Claviceps aff. humidiphila group G2b]|nr:hypothetical protein E4U32_008063 [Claviceps aff. humidiphila group G2b]